LTGMVLRDPGGLDLPMVRRAGHLRLSRDPPNAGCEQATRRRAQLRRRDQEAAMNS
jgi:hypothetical protein